MANLNIKMPKRMPNKEKISLKIYTKKFFPGKFMNVASERREETLKDKDYGLRSNEKRKDDVQKNADDILLSRYTPPGVIVNDHSNYFFYKMYDFIRMF